MSKKQNEFNEKKVSLLSVRIPPTLKKKLLAEANNRDTTLSPLVVDILDSWANKDIDTRQQLLASNSVLHSDLRRLKAELTMLQNAMYSLTYSFFIANGERCMVEFAEGKTSPVNGKEIPKDIRDKSAEMRLLADTLMKLWKNKMRRNTDVTSAIMQDAAELFNPETKNKGEKL